jgi:putative flippase GtrA
LQERTVSFASCIPNVAFHGTVLAVGHARKAALKRSGHGKVHAAREAGMFVSGRLIGQVFRFGATGVLLTCFGLGLNLLLVEIALLEPAVSYAIVLSVIALAGFVLSRTIVFTQSERPVSKAIPLYVGAFLLFRTSEWLLFTTLVYYFEVYYLVAQLMTVSLFFLLKFLGYRKIFAPPTPA